MVIQDRRVSRRQSEEYRGKVGLLRQTWFFLPSRSARQGAHGLDRLKLLRGNDSEEIAVADNFLHTRHFFDAGNIDIDKARAVARRPNNAGVNHARRPEILHISLATRHLGRNIDARNGTSHDFEARWVLQRRLRLCLNVQELIRHQFTVPELPAIVGNNNASGSLDPLGRHFQPSPGLIDQERAHLGGGIENGRPAVLQGMTAGGVAFIRRKTGIGSDQLERLEIDIELLGRDLQKRRLDALAEFGLARENRDGVVGTDADPGIEKRAAFETSRKIGRCRLLAARGRVLSDRTADR